MKINKTNVARLLDKAKVAYQLVPYEVDENDLSATHVADQLGENVAQVFKTLVLHGDESGQRTPPPHRLHPWRLLPHRHEKAFPDLYPPHRRTVRSHLCQRRTTGLADPDRSGGFDPGGTGRGGGTDT